MKLDPTVMRTMNRQDFRVLQAVETGMQSHALVPSPLIASIANLRHGGTHKIISSLLRDKLLNHDKSCNYDGYRLTNAGYDILALHNLKTRGIISGLGDQIGIGKESDIYIAVSPKGKQLVLKFHRLGRTSFRNVKKKRDYFMHNAMMKTKTGKHGVVFNIAEQPNSWLFLSRISALKEYTFMKALHDVQYPTPRPITHNRHVVAMGLVRGMPLYQLHTNKVNPDQAQSIFEQSMAICTQLARNGLVHCDLNEFNLIVDLSGGTQKSSSSNINHGDGDSISGIFTNNHRNEHEDDDDVGDHYVRHSGSSATVHTRGALSLPNHIRGKTEMHMYDGTGEIITEEPPKPKEYLENGIDPKPIVTLIDFPQMVSVKHPNAQELWERDIQCLKRFFVTKLKCDLNEDDWKAIVPKWEDLIINVDSEEQIVIDGGDENDGEDGEEKSVLTVTSKNSIIPMKQLRLDLELQASGFSKEDAERDGELYYFGGSDFVKSSNGIIDAVEEEEEEEEDNEESSIVEEGDDNGGVNTNIGKEEYDGVISDSDDDQDCVQKVDVYQGDFVNNDSYSVSGFSTLSLAQRNEHAEEMARLKVRRHLEEEKRNKTKRHAFRSRNSNKTFVKGKRVFQDFGA